MSQDLSQVFLYPRHNSFQTKGRLVRMVDQHGGDFERFQKSLKNCFLSKSNTFFAQVHWMTDEKINILTLWAL